MTFDNFFPQITQNQIQDFKKDLEKFSEKFFDYGPGAVGTDLEKGKCSFFGNSSCQWTFTCTFLCEF